MSATAMLKKVTQAMRAAFDNPFKEADLPTDIGYVKAGLKIPYPAGSVWRSMLRADEAERFKQRYAASATHTSDEVQHT